MQKSLAPVVVFPAFVAIGISLWLALRASDNTDNIPLETPKGTSSVSSVAASSVRSNAPAAINTTDMPFQVPSGFRIETFAEDVPGARVMVKDGLGNYWVSQPTQGTITHLEMENGTLARSNAVFRGMNGPHGLAIDPQNPTHLYIAEQRRIVKALLYSDAPLEEIAQLPPVGLHRTRSLAFGTDGRLYVSAGSTCNVCVEENKENAAMFSMNKDGTDRKLVATGLRNPVFFAVHPATGAIWATDMGRDNLGDALPADEVNVIQEGAHYGWPFCYGDNVRDSTFRASDAFDCAATKAPLVQLPAHVAPLGLTFIRNDSWPEEYAWDLLIAEHGSWNSSVPVGYKIIRIPLSANGQREGDPQDFLTGFLSGGSAKGRPVDLLIDGESLFITDDKAGAVYRMSPLSL